MESCSVSTDELFADLFRTTSLTRYMGANEQALDMEPFHEYLSHICREQKKIPGHVIQKANIETSYGYQIFAGKRNPLRDTVLQLAFVLEADVALAQELLRHAGQSALYPRVRRDAAIIYCLYHNISLVRTQTVLDELELLPIGGKHRGG